MRNELITLVDAFRGVAFDAGWALLHQNDSVTVHYYAHRYDELCRRFCELAPVHTCSCRRLPESASAGQIRLAARDAARIALDVLASSCLSNRWAA